MSTTNFLLATLGFSQSTWHDQINNNFIALDALIATVLRSDDYRGIWSNSQNYLITELAVDPDTGEVYLCLVAHTSAGSGTFAADRAANPTYWTLFNFSISRIPTKELLVVPTSGGFSLTSSSSAQNILSSGNIGTIVLDSQGGWTVNAAGIVVPSGVTKIEVKASFYFDWITSGQASAIKFFLSISPSTSLGGGMLILPASSSGLAGRFELSSGVYFVTPGDVIRLLAVDVTGSNLGSGTILDFHGPTAASLPTAYSRSFVQVYTHYN